MDKVDAQALRDANIFLTAGRAAEQEDRTCAGWETAVGDYYNAADAFLRGGDFEKSGQALQKAVELRQAVEVRVEMENVIDGGQNLSKSQRKSHRMTSANK